jgi:hypothetical protein
MSSGQRLRGHSSIILPFRAITNSPDSRDHGKQQQSERGRVTVAPLLLSCITQEL